MTANDHLVSIAGQNSGVSRMIWFSVDITINRTGPLAARCPPSCSFFLLSRAGEENEIKTSQVKIGTGSLPINYYHGQNKLDLGGPI